MKKVISIIIAITISVFTLEAIGSWKGHQPKPTMEGVLIEASGSVVIRKPNGSEVSPKTGLELAPASTVTAGRNGSASVMLTNGTTVKVEKGRTYLVGVVPEKQKDDSMLKGLTVALNEAANVKIPSAYTEVSSSSQPANQNAAPRVRGMVKMGQLGPGVPRKVNVAVGEPSKQKRVVKKKVGLEGIYPVKTSLTLPDEINFQWNMKPAFAQPVLVIVDSENNTKTFEIKNPTNVEIEADEMALARGNEYKWYLASKTDNAKKKRSGTYTFNTLSKEKEDSLKKDISNANAKAETETGKALLKAQAYYSYGLYDNMVKTLLPIWEKDRSPTVKNLLKLGYAKMGLYEEARKYK